MSVLAQRYIGAKGAAAVYVRTPADGLRLRVLEALESEGVGIDAAAHRRHIRDGFTAAEPIAAELIELLETRVEPESDHDFSLLSNLAAMAAFGCLITDYAYSKVAITQQHKVDVARYMSIFVVASALFDHICDRQPELLPVLEATVSVEWLRAAFAGKAPGDPPVEVAGPAPVVYLGELGAEAARLWSRLTSDTKGIRIATLHAALWDRLAAAYDAQIASVPESASGHAASRDVEVIWAAPFTTALYVVASTSDTAPRPKLHTLLPEAQRIGLLLSLIDDLADVEDDWRWGSANQYLDRAGIGRRIQPGITAPWTRLLADEVLVPYLHEIVRLVNSLSDVARESLVAWLVYWLVT